MVIAAPPFSGDSSVPIGDPTVDAIIGSLWRRVVAFAVDAIILGVVGSLVALPFFDTFSRLGAWGRLVGFCIALPYFAILESSIGNGRSLGKRWLRLQVVDAEGKPIPLRRSALRYTFFAFPYFLNNISLPVTRTPWTISALISIVVFGLGGANLYLVFFNRHTRQGIHDLFARSYVVASDKNGRVKTRPIWDVHWIILAALIVVLLLSIAIGRSTLARVGSFPQMLDDTGLVENMVGVRQAGVEDLTQYSFSGTNEKIFIVNVVCKENPSNAEGFADQVAGLILRHDPYVQDHDLLRIAIIRSYDIGIASAHTSHSFQHTPAEWNDRLLNQKAE